MIQKFHFWELKSGSKEISVHHFLWSIAHNNQEVERTQMSMDEVTEKEDEVNHGTLCSHKKKENPVTCWMNT